MGKKKEVGERPFKTADEQGKRSARSKIWALGQVVVGGIILVSEIGFWILFFCGNEYMRAIWSTENQPYLVLQTPLAIGTAIVMIDSGVDGLRVRAARASLVEKRDVQENKG